MATGRLSAFLDAIENTKSSVVTQDSWVQRLSDRRKRLELYGDNTWLKLFPQGFTKADGVSSFFVRDFYEVRAELVENEYILRMRNDIMLESLN
ncbi:unnamed protein product [Dibothriocephalus latus]|uniref:Uncharacterized protein n=1 Tax=Dibothriocephalus latus TaxID=60516 RepID=A0A3P6U8R3_DIBLA|nr:unnamed protein product [Dibothriocephalus latus]